MPRRFRSHHWLCLFILSLFVLEYLEPSAVGVRADFDPPLNQGKAGPKSAKNLEDGGSDTPHAMLSTGNALPGTRLIVRTHRVEPSLQPRQCASSKVYRPPLAVC